MAVGIGSISLKRLLLADRVEVKLSSEFSLFYIVCHLAHSSCWVANKDAAPMLFTSEAAAWKVVRRYRDIDDPGLVD